MSPTAGKPLDWLMLIHNLPPRPLYLRARIRRLLDQAGAIALKQSVYALPAKAGGREALGRIGEEAIARGGHAYVCQARFLDPGTDSLLVEKLAALETQAEGRPGRSDLVGRTWATRRGIQIDRIASAWLIRRFIDPRARFRFIDPAEEREPNELRFDMPGGDFSHEEDRCTFETLILRIGLSDPALQAVAEIVHDIDIKDGKFDRSEARGVEQLVLGMLADRPTDRERLEKGFALFDDLYRSFLRSRGRAAARRPTR